LLATYDAGSSCCYLVVAFVVCKCDAGSSCGLLVVAFVMCDLLSGAVLSPGAHHKSLAHSAGYIAKAIGPQDVLVTLLNNLKVQERQNRVCTTVAIAIVAETCSPFTVLPALMNEYKVRG
jgi:hypothetical protein